MINSNKIKLFHAVGVETINKCNRKCWFCKFGQLNKNETTKIMSWELIEKIIYNLKDLKYKNRISWYQINEPLLDKRIYDIIKFTKKHLPESYCSLISNGDLIDKEKIIKFENSGIDKIGISCYELESLEKAKNLAKNSKIILVRNQIDKGFVENRGNNISIPKNLERENKDNFNCLRPSTMINIKSDGLVPLCCADFYNEVIMGDVKEEKLEKIWFNKKFQKYREHLSKKGRKELELCAGCTHSGKGHDIYLE